MRDPKPECGAAESLLVELGGWYDHVAFAELQTVAGGRAASIGHRLAVVSGTEPSELLRLGASRYVHRSLGRACSPSDLPAAVTEEVTGSYAVRFEDPRRQLSERDRRLVISNVWRAHAAPRVDLREPDHDLRVYANDEGLWFGVRIGRCSPELTGRQRRRPFFRSYELPARKARVLVNLSDARPGDWFVDPFCGTGALVIEAGRIGCRALGFDIDGRAVTGAAVNARFEGVNAFHAVADARLLPLAGGQALSVAADLPYGRSAARRHTSGRDLYRRFLGDLAVASNAGSRAVVMSLADDLVPNESPGWSLAWVAHEDARTVARSIAIWTRI